MSRRLTGETIDVERRDEVPQEFRWRGRLYVVRDVLGHWLEAGSWWRAAGARSLTAGDDAPALIDDGEREFWRVEASSARPGAAGTPAGVYDLCLDWSRGGWTVARVLD